MSEYNRSIGIIVLAAGSSSRMGQSKQLLLVDGEPLLLRTTNTALDSRLENVIVVLGSHEEEHRKIIESLPLEIVFNEHWKNGMGSSLRSGILHLLKQHPDIEGAIILVCDQPFLTADHIERLLKKNSETKNPIVASTYAGAIGVPALFERSIFPQLLALKDEHGAKKVINENMNSVSMIKFSSGEIDLDTMEDYYKFKNKTS